jgi:hypothetical protein
LLPVPDLLLSSDSALLLSGSLEVIAAQHVGRRFFCGNRSKEVVHESAVV